MRLPAWALRATNPPVSRGTPQIEGSTAAQDALRDWEAVRASPDIQFSPLPPVKPAEPPHWLKDMQQWLRDLLAPINEWLGSVLAPIGAFLRRLFGPLAELLGVSWPVFEKILIGLAILGAVLLTWRVVAPWWTGRRSKSPRVEPEWAPPHEVALALLEDADRLADEGRFGEAVHLLLQRSVGHIAEAQPDWLQPASTAREIANLPLLPEGARRAFSVVAARVERSRFALRDLDADDWLAARSAYADFALTPLASRFAG